MHSYQHTGLPQKGLGLGFQAVRFALTAGVAVLLITAWMLTAGIFRFGIYLSDQYRTWLEMKG